MKVKYAQTSLQKIRGLMFRKKHDYALVFNLNKKTKLGASIHSFFVFFAFDIIWLDKSTIIDMRENVKPFTLNITPEKPADSFVELPKGSIKKMNLKKGMKFKIKI